MNERSNLGYQFIAMNKDHDRILSIDEELVDVSRYVAEEIDMIHKDYIPTSRFIDFISPHSLLFPKQNTHDCSPQMSLEEDFAQHGLTNNF